VIAWYKDSVYQSFDSLFEEQNSVKQLKVEKSKPKRIFRLTFYHWIITRLISCKLELFILNT